MNNGVKYEIRVYYQRYNMDWDYYSGTKGIRRRWKAKSPEELLRKMRLHFEENEGETYSVCADDEMIIGGAWDGNDEDVVMEYFGL